MGTFEHDNVCQTIKTITQWTNQTIAKGYISGLGILEETITDFILNEIAIRHSTYIFTKKFSRKQEGCESGADWLWCIGGPGAWLPILIQAKVINPVTKRCHYLDYSTRRGKQRSLLLRYARNHRLLPLYCIYSLVDKDITPEAIKLDSLSNLNPKDWACSFIIPRYVSQLTMQDEKSQSDLLRYGIPWIFPFCEAKDARGIKLARSIAKSMFKIYREFAKRDGAAVMDNQSRKSRYALVVQPKHEKNSRIQWASVDPTKLVTPEIPRLVIRLLKSRVRQDDAPVSAVSIISNTPVEAVLKEQGALPPPDENRPLFKGPKQRENDLWRRIW